ncbi:ABC transporter ATP-binding protein [Candidatus Pelagibacter sp.]|nr:ABC transporter ATP-binding protein [Candidatus Pelagibacter sp.]
MIGKIIDLFKFFDKNLQSKLLFTQVIFVISSTFELLTIFSVGPLVQVLSDPNIINEQDQFITKVYNFLNFPSFETFLIFLVLIIFGFLFISTFILSYTMYILCMFSQTLGNVLRSNLFKFYISQPWLYHSKSNTTEYTENVFYEANRVSQGIIFPILLTISKLLTGLMVIIALTIYNPIASIVCFIVFGILYGSVFRFIKTKVTLHGTNQSVRMSEMYRVMTESFVGIKEAIIYGNQKKYFDQFYRSGSKYSESVGKVYFLAHAPKHILEFLAFSIILLFIIFLVFVGNADFNDALPILVVYIFAGYKLLPIFQFIYSSIVQIKGNLPAYEKIKNELTECQKYTLKSETQKKNNSEFNHENLISLRKVSFSYNKLNKQALKNVSINLNSNSLSYIVGPSGSGKSTLLDLILGLIFPQKGNILIGDTELNEFNSNIWHQNISYVGQNIFLLDDTIKNNICFVEDEKIIDEHRLNKALKLSNVDNFLKELPSGLETIVGERGLKLSGGQRQRVALARAFYQNKKIIILDEATASLDGITENFIIDQLKNLSKDKTVIMVTHNVKLCQNADIIYLLDNGSIKDFGDYDKLKKDNLFLKLLNEK